MEQVGGARADRVVRPYERDVGDAVPYERDVEDAVPYGRFSTAYRVYVEEG